MNEAGRERRGMNPKIERVREDIKRTEKKIRELDEYLKSLRIREKQLCDDELIKVMRGMAGKDGDVIAILDAFQKSHEDDGASDLPGKPGDNKKSVATKPDTGRAPDKHENAGREKQQDVNGDMVHPEKTSTGADGIHGEIHAGINRSPAGTDNN